MRDERKRHTYKGTPNTRTGACYTAKDFRSAIESYENERSKRETDKAKRRDERAQKKLDRQAAAEVAKKSVKCDEEKSKKRKAPDPGSGHDKGSDCGVDEN